MPLFDFGCGTPIKWLLILVLATTHVLGSSNFRSKDSTRNSTDAAQRRAGKAWSVPFNTELLKHHSSRSSDTDPEDGYPAPDSSSSHNPQIAYSPEAYGKPLNKAQQYSYSYLYPQESTHSPTYAAANDDSTSTYSTPADSKSPEAFPSAGYYSPSDLKNHRLSSTPYKTKGPATGVKFPSKSYDYNYDYPAKYGHHYPQQGSNEYGFQPSASRPESEYQNTGSAMASAFSKPEEPPTRHTAAGGYYASEFLGGRYAGSGIHSKKTNLQIPILSHPMRPPHDSSADDGPDVSHDTSMRDDIPDSIYGESQHGYPVVGFIERDDQEFYPSLEGHKYGDKYLPHPPLSWSKYLDYIPPHAPYPPHPHHHKKSGFGSFGLLLGLLPLGLLAATLMPSIMAMPVTVASGRKKRSTSSPEDRIQVLYNHPVLDKIAKYGMTSLDDPECLQQIFCEITTDGKTDKSNVVQKLIYKLISWTSDEVAEKLGMKVLVRAVQRQQCEVFHCSKNKTKVKTS